MCVRYRTKYQGIARRTRRYPRRKGIPLSKYHFLLLKNSRASAKSHSLMPGSRMIELRGRLAREVEYLQVPPLNRANVSDLPS